jgi:hypothetical protein
VREDAECEPDRDVAEEDRETKTQPASESRPAASAKRQGDRLVLRSR